MSEALVLEKLQRLDGSKATGLDAIPSRFLRDAAEIITPSITHIVNKSIEQGQFPNDLKIARVIPLYKKGSKQDPGNYRPVSILSSLSKILLILILIRLSGVGSRGQQLKQGAPDFPFPGHIDQL